MSANLACNIEIEIEGNPARHFTYQILMDGYPYETGEASSAQSALTAAALWLNRKCKKCGCTFLNGCYQGDDKPFCHWVKPDLCSDCVPKVKARRS